MSFHFFYLFVCIRPTQCSVSTGDPQFQEIVQEVTQDKTPGNFYLKTSARFSLPAIGLKKHWMRFGAQPEGEMPPQLLPGHFPLTFWAQFHPQYLFTQRGFRLPNVSRSFLCPKTYFVVVCQEGGKAAQFFRKTPNFQRMKAPKSRFFFCVERRLHGGTPDLTMVNGPTQNDYCD